MVTEPLPLGGRISPFALCPSDPHELPDFPFGYSQPFYSLPAVFDDGPVPGLKKDLRDTPGQVILRRSALHALCLPTLSAAHVFHVEPSDDSKRRPLLVGSWARRH